MSYLNIETICLDDIDSLIEECFDYAYEREDECLFESMILNELSDGLKLHAGLKALTRINNYGNPSYLKDEIDTAKKIKEKFSNVENSEKSRLVKAQHVGSELSKLLGGKRNRILRNLYNAEVGTKTGRKTIDGHDERVPCFAKDEIKTHFQNMNDENIHKEYNELRKELENLNKNNPYLTKNDRKTLKLFKTKPQYVKLNDENNQKSSHEETNGTSAENDQNKNQGEDKIKPGLKSRIIKFIKSLKRKYNNIKRKINNTPPEQRSLLQKFMYKIIQIIDKVSGWLNKSKKEE